MIKIALGFLIGYAAAWVERQIKLRRAAKMLKDNLEIQKDYYKWK
jgi:ribosomal protein L19E